MDQQILSASLKYALEIAHTEDGWIQPLWDDIKDVDAELAKWKPSPEVASIWEITAHAVPYTEGRASDFTGAAFPDDPDWPEVSDTSAAAWAALKERAHTAITKLHSVVAEQSDEQLAAPRPEGDLPRAMRLLDIVVHNAYHAGQIVKLTQLYRASRVPVGV